MLLNPERLISVDVTGVHFDCFVHDLTLTGVAWGLKLDRCPNSTIVKCKVDCGKDFSLKVKHHR